MAGGTQAAVSAARRMRVTRDYRAALVAGGAALACLLLLIVQRGASDRFTLLSRAEAWTLDQRFSLRGARPSHRDHVVVVGIDADTIARRPDLVRTRRVWADLVGKLSAAGVKAIAIDAYFPDDERLVPPELALRARASGAELGELHAAPGTPIERARGVLADTVEAADGDRVFAASFVAARHVVLASYFDDLEQSSAPSSVPVGGTPPGLSHALLEDGVQESQNAVTRRPWRGERHVTLPIDLLAEAAPRVGFVNVQKDADGVVRGMYATLERAQAFYAPLALSAIAESEHGSIGYVAGAETMDVAGHRLAVDPLAVARLDFYDSLPSVSAADVLDGKVDDKLTGRIAFVGFTDSGHDVVQTPLTALANGVEIHATFAENVLHGEVFTPAPAATDLAAIALFGVVGVLLSLPRFRRHAAALGGGQLVLAFLWGVFAWVAFLHGTVVPVFAPIAAALVIGGASIATALGAEREEKRWLRAAFSRYLSPAVVDRLVDDPAQARLGGERRELTVLFSDIRGFSGIAEALEPGDLTRFLSEYFGPMSDVVQADGGFVDKYIGDGLMAFWGAPIEMPDHAARAARAALAMQTRLTELNARWRERALPEVRIGIGLSSGAMSFGNMGSEDHFDYTVIGDAVNAGSRLEALTKEFKTGILASDRARELASAKGAFVWRELDRVRLRGREEAAPVFELLGTGEPSAVSASRLRRFGDALAAYRRRDWAAAEQGFSAIVGEDPGDGPASVMLERVRRLAKNPPPEGWDGVYDQTG